MAQLPAPRPRLLRHWLLAAALALSALPGSAAQVGGVSPLDRLDPAQIPPLERFEWHPKELVAVVGEHRGRQGSQAISTAFSPEGRLLASGGSNGTIRLWDRGSMRQEAIVGAHSGAVRALAFFPDGAQLATCGDDATVRLWHMTEFPPKLRVVLPAGSAPLYGLAVAPNGKMVAAGGVDTTLRVWDVDEKEVKKKGELQGHTGVITGVAFSHDGKTIATSSRDDTIRFWNATEEKVKERLVLTANSKGALAVAFAPEGGIMASAGVDDTVRLWNISTATPKQSLSFHKKNGTVYSLAFGPKGSKTLATGGSDQTARVWSLATTPPRERTVALGHTGAINGVALGKPARGPGLVLASASADWSVRVWDATLLRPKDRTVVVGHYAHTYAVGFTPDAKTLASGSEDRALRFWDMTGPGPKESYVRKKDALAVYTLSFSPDGRLMAYAGNDAAVRIWDIKARRELPRLPRHPGAVGRVVFSPDGRRLLACSLTKVLLWDVENAKLLREMEGHTRNVADIAFAPDGRRAVSCSGGYELDKLGRVVYKDGRPVYTDCTVRLWDTESADAVHAFKNHELPILCVTYARDGKRLVYGAQEPLVRQWEMDGDKPGKMTVLKGRGGYVWTVSYSPDGKMLATVGLDGKLILWDSGTGQRLREWTFAETYYRVAWAPDNRHLAVPVATGVVYILRLPPTGPPGK